MTELLGVYPDAEQVIRGVLAPLGVTLVTATPVTMVPPLIALTRVGGDDDGLTDHAHVEVAVFAVDRPGAWSLSERARQLVLAAPHTEVPLDTGIACIDYTIGMAAPQLVPYPDQDLRLVVAVYQLSMRRLRTT